ncbi:MAG: type II toxin-antitoxin system RelE/ParE family toxin [Gammaproteobacteria bacterium]|nr:type II toxin-antitoxin system RelE/ParE family toxin [Gammaproteobacteria bacterium]HXK56281.1 type II toxin-antitoxin system RelE/ParE family toxin [Gammaproteobacteria bacterium]
MLIVRKEAEQDLKQAFDWYEAQRKNLGLSFLTEVEKLFDNIEENPQLYFPIALPISRALCKRFPYAVYFLKRGSNIDVLAVLHQRRKPSAWRKRFHT